MLRIILLRRTVNLGYAVFTLYIRENTVRICVDMRNTEVNQAISRLLLRIRRIMRNYNREFWATMKAVYSGYRHSSAPSRR